jgi:hypothetical protein
MNVCVLTVSSSPDPNVISAKNVLYAVTSRCVALMKYDGTWVLRTLVAAQHTSCMFITVP